MTKSSFIIIPAHNRRNYTLFCLHNLLSIGVMQHCRIIVVDDGSTDGTAESICSEFPEVTLLQGDGSLYWTGAIEMGMRYAMSHGAECMIWLNDDSKVSSGSIERLAQVASETGGIASALGFVDMHTIGKKWYFPAQKKTLFGLKNIKVTPNSGLIPTDACRGNLVAIHRSVIEKIGYPDGCCIPHVAGDSDYTLRTTEAGIPCCLVSDVLLEELGTIRKDNESWLLGDNSVSQLWKGIICKRNSNYIPMKWRYLRRHWGLIGLMQFPIPYVKLGIISVLKLLLPQKTLLAIYGKKSHAWKTKSWSRALEG